MKKNTVALAVAAAMTASLLVGCGGTAADSTSTAESTATSTDAASAATTTAGGDETLTVWAWDPNFNIYALKQAEAIYQKDHPNFKLDIQENTYNDIETKLITAATSGDYSTLPDVFLMQDYSFHKYIANFPDVFTDITDSGIDFTQFTEGKLADSTADGKHYGVPFDNGATVMAVRSDMIENAGLTVDDFKDLTWSEFIPKAQKVVDANGVSMIASSGGSEMLMEMLQSAGSSPLQDGKVNVAGNAALKEAMTQYKAMVDAGIIAEYTDWDQYIASMNDGKTAGVVNGCWIMSSIQAAADQSGKWAIVNMPIKGKGIYRTMIFLPCATSLVSYSMIFKSLFATDGLINHVISAIGLAPIDWFQDAWAARWVIIIALIWRRTGYNMVFYLAGLQNIDYSIYEAARIDGASPVQQFFHLTIPLLKPTILLTAIMSTSGTLQLFDESVNLTAGGPGKATMTLTHYIYNISFVETPKFNYAAALSVFILVVVAVLSAIQMKVGDKRE